MEYEARMKLIAGELNGFLRRYKRPDHLDNDQALIEIKAMATAVNKRIQSGLSQSAVLSKLDSAFQEVAELFRGREWPKPALFVEAMANVNRSAPSGDVTADDWVLDPIQIAADRINAGDAVGDNWLYGHDAVSLMRSGMVSKETMRKYRSAMYFKTKDVIKNEAEARRREDLLIRKHEAAENLFDHRGNKGFSAAGVVSAVAQSKRVGGMS